MDIRKLAPGDRILDYRILERLGEGGFGEVFRAEHELLERIVAIKVPRDQSALTALRHEGVVQASLDHPGIVRTLELSISHDPPYVVMEYVDGPSLAQILKKQGALSWKKAARILLAAARSLAHAHEHGVVHGDVKPGNILVERRKKGNVLLTDFGLGRVFEGPQGNLQISRSLELAASGAEVQGTIRYLAPELLRGEQADERADMYSFGVLLFEVLTGRLPEGREVPSDLVKDLPEALDRIFERMFTRKERRPRSLQGTIEELEALLEPKKAKAAEPATEIVKAIPVSMPTPLKSAARHVGPREVVSANPTVHPSLETLRSSPVFSRWRDALVAKINEGISCARGVSIADGRGFDACYGVNAEGEPHHRVYALVVPRLDAAGARAVVAEARRIFDLEKGIWEKEVTFWVIAKEVRDHNQVLWACKSFSMGWWRRRRIVLQDVSDDRLYATELGCDPRGNPLKRAFHVAAQQAVSTISAEPELPDPVMVGPRRCNVARGTAWGAALALLVTFSFLGVLMAVEAVRTVGQRGLRDVPALRAAPCEEVGLPERTPDAFTPEERPVPKYF